MPHPATLTAEQAAAFLQVHKSTVLAMARSGAHVVANGAEEAQKMAQLKYAMDERDAGNQPEDYHVLFVALGHHQDLSI